MNQHRLILLPLLLAVPTTALAGDDEEAALTIPLPPDLPDYVRDLEAAAALGKALFWDEQVGSDGRTACATCHYAGGADIRTLDSLHPGANGVFEEDGTRFPFLSDDVLGSQGIQRARFVQVVPHEPVEVGIPEEDPLFGFRRQVTGRNSLSVVNAVFYTEQFWDGRASSVFNGVDEAGDESADARVLEARADGSVRPVRVSIEDASLASQAVGPVLSSVEMSYAGRTFLDVGKKMLSLRPLALQEVHPDDSVLSPLRSPAGTGLSLSYPDLIRAAFEPRWWSSTALVDRDLEVVGSGEHASLDEFTQMEANFSLFWGLSILVYESTLVSGETRYDRFLAGETNALTRAERRGLEVYEGRGRCDQCHGQGPELSQAAITNGGNGRAYTNTAVRPVSEDPGRGDGEFKSVTTRINELNGPYFHNGGYLTLRQVVDFYDRGGDFPGDETDSQVRELGLSEREKDDLVAFLLALTDERVRFQRAPFDHPSLDIPDGLRLPAVGREGGPPLPRFLDADPFQE